MYVPQVKKKGEQKKHFFQRHPTIGRFFETFGFFAWIIVLVVLASIVMLAVPSWRPIYFDILRKIGYYWNYFWGEWIYHSLRWDWSEGNTP